MSLIVQKYGGSSLATAVRIRSVAEHVARQRARGAALVVVVSAMGKSTDQLLDLARAVAPSAAAVGREHDQLLATGEQVAAALLALALAELGVPARSLTGEQAGVVTDGLHGGARIRQIRRGPLRRALAQGCTPIVTGFQGRGDGHSVCTLGRGGSDTSAVALAVVLGAERCDLFTDVAGVFTADPRRVPTAGLHPRLTHREALQLALCGAVVLHPRAAALAAAHGLPLRILSSAEPDSDTCTYIHGGSEMEEPRLLGVAVMQGVVQLAVELPRANDATAAAVLGALTGAGLSVQSLSLAAAGAAVRFDARVVADDGEAACRAAADALGHGARVALQPPLARVCLVGSGLSGEPGLLQKALGALGATAIVVEAVEATDLGVALYVASTHADAAARLLHDRLLGEPVPPDGTHGVEHVALHSPAGAP